MSPLTAACASAYCCVCVLILLYMCPHTAIYMSSYCYICVLILLYMCPHTATGVSHTADSAVWPHTAIKVSAVWPHTAIYVSSYCYRRVSYGAICSSAYCYVCPHTAIYVSSYCYICVFILLQARLIRRYKFALILLYMCPHTAI
jgi:hypothetical protein